MKHDLSKLFTGKGGKATFEFVSKRKGPFTGKTLKVATDSAEHVAAFHERNLPPAPWEKQPA